MRKIKTKGLKFKVKPVDKGPRFCVALHKVKSNDKAKELLGAVFEANEALIDVVISSVPVVICRDLDQSVATNYVKKLKGAGDFRVWLESAASRMKQMNLKQKGATSPMPRPHVRKH